MGGEGQLLSLLLHVLNRHLNGCGYDLDCDEEMSHLLLLKHKEIIYMYIYINLYKDFYLYKYTRMFLVLSIFSYSQRLQREVVTFPSSDDMRWLREHKRSPTSSLWMMLMRVLM